MNISVSLTTELAALIKAKVESGRYASASEVVREALRLLESPTGARPSASRRRAAPGRKAKRRRRRARFRPSARRAAKREIRAQE